MLVWITPQFQIVWNIVEWFYDINSFHRNVYTEILKAQKVNLCWSNIWVLYICIIRNRNNLYFVLCKYKYRLCGLVNYLEDLYVFILSYLFSQILWRHKCDLTINKALVWFDNYKALMAFFGFHCFCSWFGMNRCHCIDFRMISIRLKFL